MPQTEFLAHAALLGERSTYWKERLQGYLKQTGRAEQGIYSACPVATGKPSVHEERLGRMARPAQHGRPTELAALCTNAEADGCSSYHGQERVSLVSWPCLGGLLSRVSAAPQLPARCQEGWSPVFPFSCGRRPLQRPGRSATRALRTLK